MHELRGYVRYRFRSIEEDVDVLFEGEADWVRSLVKELGLDGVGWMMPLAVDSINLSSSGLSDDSSLELSGKPKDMGPEPDPSRIPIIRRPIGELNLAAKLAEVGLEKPVRPTPEDLRDELDELEKPLPTRDPMSTDPMAEAWLKELLRIVVRTYGITAISTVNIELAATDLLGDREDLELELWLESLFRGGKLVKVHGGDETGWGPSPGWLSRTL